MSECCAVMARMERCMRGECVATALCGVTDGDSERQTELSEREEEDILVLQTPAPCHGSGMSAMPCPSSLSCSNQEKHRAFDLIWMLWIHHPVVFLEVLQGETQFKKRPKRAHQAYLKSALCSEVWRVEAEGCENILWLQPILLPDGWKAS